jgi:hypothetical protein
VIVLATAVSDGLHDVSAVNATCLNTTDIVNCTNTLNAVHKQAGVDEGEDSGSSQRASQAIEAALGTEKRNGVLAALYLARSDTSSVVRQGALQVTFKHMSL